MDDSEGGHVRKDHRRTKWVLSGDCLMGPQQGNNPAPPLPLESRSITRPPDRNTKADHQRQRTDATLATPPTTPVLGLTRILKRLVFMVSLDPFPGGVY